MANRGHRKPAAAVVGLGAYYQKLKPGLNQYFDSIALLDSDTAAQAALDMREQELFRVCKQPHELPELINSADVVFILTPTDTHLPYAKQAILAGKAVLIEKPLTASFKELEVLRELVSEGARVYCSDFYVDVRAIPLLAATGNFSKDDWQTLLIETENASPVERIELGQLQRIEGCIAEDYAFRFDNWSGHRRSGGVILEMMVHLFALLKKIFPDESMQIWDSKRLFARPGVQGKYDSESSDPDVAEAYARIQGQLTPSGVPVSFEAFKQAERSNRFFKIVGSRGSVTQFFEPGHPLHISIGAKSETWTLRGDRYELVSLAVRRWFESGASPYGVDWSEWAAKQSIEARDWKRPPKTVTVSTSNASEEKVDQGRRSLGKMLGGGLLALASPGANSLMLGINSVLVGVNSKLVLEANHLALEASRQEQANAATADLQRRSESTERLIDSDRVAAISRLVGSSERLILSPGSEHLDLPKLRGRGYPHDLSALAPFRHIIEGPLLELGAPTIQEYVRKGDIVVGTGSPMSSILARDIMSSDAKLSYELPYRIETIEGKKFVKVVSGTLGGKEEDKYGKRLIETATGEEKYTDKRNLGPGNWLKRDFLLMSRVPSQFPGCDLLLISGGHGPGTQAAELLFDPKMVSPDDLSEIQRHLKGSPYWQIVFEVEEIHHELGFMSVAHSLRLSPWCPPKILNTNSRPVGSG